MTDSNDSADGIDRRTVLRRMTAAGAAAAGTASVASGAGPQQVSDPQARLSDSDLLDQLSAEGLVSEPSAETLPTERLRASELADGADGTAEVQSQDTRYLVTQQTTDEGQLRVFHDVETGTEYAVHDTESDLQVYHEGGVESVESFCLDWCTTMSCFALYALEEKRMYAGALGGCLPYDYTCSCI